MKKIFCDRCGLEIEEKSGATVLIKYHFDKRDPVEKEQDLCYNCKTKLIYLFFANKKIDIEEKKGLPKKKTKKIFYLQNRYQDSNWTTLSDLKYSFYSREEAEKVAEELSKEAMFFGMVRVMPEKINRKITTFAAGGERIH